MITIKANSHEPSGILIYTVENQDSIFRLSSFGGQLLGWKKNGIGILFENRETAIIDGKTAYRGGIPICFPYFGKGLLLPKATEIQPQHGKARTARWLTELRNREIIFSIEQPSPAGYPETTFLLAITYNFESDVAVNAVVTNIGKNPSPFQLAFHSYWSCVHPEKTQILQLGDIYLDNLAELQERPDQSEGYYTPPFDRVYPKASQIITVLSQQFEVRIQTVGSQGSVIWNPGANHTLKDLPPGVPPFICVESGIIAPPAVLEPEHTAAISLSFAVSV